MMAEITDGASRFRPPKTLSEVQLIAYEAVPASTKYKSTMAAGKRDESTDFVS